jgi:hypothetical protein
VLIRGLSLKGQAMKRWMVLIVNGLRVLMIDFQTDLHNKKPSFPGLDWGTDIKKVS